MLSLRGLNVHYGKIHALRDLSLSVGEGEAVSVVGANGAGKSTLMWTLAGVLRPTSGEIFFAGAPLPWTARLGAFFQGVPFSLSDAAIAGEHFVLQAEEEGLGT